jgi:hypothetical protein
MKNLCLLAATYVAAMAGIYLTSRVKVSVWMRTLLAWIIILLLPILVISQAHATGTNITAIRLQGWLLPYSQTVLSRPQWMMLGTDPASGTDSSELHRIFGQIVVNQTNTWFRAAFVKWSDIETAPGVYTFTNWVVAGQNHGFDNWLAANTVTNFDATIAPLPINQPKIMFNIQGAPSWIVYTNSTQAQYIADETNLVKAILNHAPGRIWAIEFTNEPFTNLYPGMTTSYTNTAIFVAQLAAAVRKAVH